MCLIDGYVGNVPIKLLDECNFQVLNNNIEELKKELGYTSLKVKLNYAASLAIKSTSLFNLSVECAFTQLHFISNSLVKRSNSVQSSLFLTFCLFAVFHPFFFQL